MVGEVCRWGGAYAHAGWIGIIRVEPVEKHPYCLIVVFGWVWQWVFSLRRMRRADLVLSLEPKNNMIRNTVSFEIGADCGRSDMACFFTDMQVSSPTALEMSVKKPDFLHRLSNVTEGS